jgi:fumarylacetoacetate (FAA) hydrolase family protein
MRLDRTCLPADLAAGTFAARIMTPEGPCIIGLVGAAAFDLTPAFGTMSRWMEEEHPGAAIRARGAPMALDLDALLANSAHDARDPAKPWLLAPIDLQAVKAAGVTYVRSMLERVIEERCRGDASAAAAVRIEVREIIGDDLASLVPGSAEAVRVKEALVAKGWWSQYLEVGIGPDAEIFSKCPPMAAVGCGAKVGVHPGSQWSNPEPEAVMVVNSRGRIQGATLGNDVNLRDFEGRSALLLGKAKDNNASCAVGPFIRLFDEHFDIDDVRQCELSLKVQGPEGFVMQGSSALNQISRDPLDLAGQAMGPNHQYPDGMVLFLGTMFAPTQDRHGPGQGFTHVVGDVVSISTPQLGTLVNRVTTSDQAPAWTYGVGALMRDLAKRQGAG